MIGRMRVAFARIGLPAWFIAIDLLWIAKPDVLGIDARHYQRAASEWLAGGDPWKVTEGGIPFAAGPHTLLFYAPTSVLPLSASVWELYRDRWDWGAVGGYEGYFQDPRAWARDGYLDDRSSSEKPAE